MKRVQLGSPDLLVSPLALGGNVFGWTISEQTSREILDAFSAAGHNLVDTADFYYRWGQGVGGESETIIGNWMKKRGNRRQMVIATKLGKDMGNGNKGLSKKYIIKAAEASLKRLQTDCIDLYQSHDDDLDTPLEESLEGFQQLIRDGKVLHIGASNYTGERLKLALETSEKYGLPRYTTLQPHYNLVERPLFEAELEQVCLAHKLGILPYYPLASGFLTGKYRSEDDITKSVRGKTATKYFNEKGMAVLKALDEISAKHKVQPASVALAWLMTRPCTTAPIASATSTEQLNDLLAAANLSLDAKDLELLDAVSV